MTPQEKAQRLLSIHSLTILSKIGHKLPMSEVKEMAIAGILLNIDEMIETLREAASEEVVTIHVIYWSKVKQELEKL